MHFVTGQSNTMDVVVCLKITDLGDNIVAQ